MKFTPATAGAAGQRGGRSTSARKAQAVRLNAQRAWARELAKQYPCLGRPHWSPADVVIAGRRLKRLPPPERERVTVLLEVDNLPPDRVLLILQNLSRKPSAEREAIYALAGHSRWKPLAQALGLPPPPLHPAMPYLQRACDELRLAAHYTRVVDLRPDIIALYTNLVELMRELADRRSPL